MTVKARPILFSGPMVRALLAGTKTQTRRIVKQQPELRDISGVFSSWVFKFPKLELLWPNARAEIAAHCPYGQPGDLLWVREASADVHPLAVQSDRFSVEGQAGIPGPPPVDYRRVYRADGDVLQVWHTSKGHPYRTLDGPEDEIAAKHPSVSSEWVGRLKYQPWIPGIHMPRWASRLTLRITEVRVQRLQECSNEDAIAEGIGTPLDARYAAAHEYRALWESINGPNSWNANPWIWALTFEVLHANVDRVLEQAAA